METYKKIEKALKILKGSTSIVPKVALVLGSGLGAFAEEIDVVSTLDYAEIDGFPVSTVPGHRGRFVFGYIGDVPVVLMQGRVHYYEGYDLSDVVMPIRLMVLLGAKTLFLTNASGAINTAYSAGDFVLLRDHIVLGVPSPLIGPNIEELGTRFPDMSAVYDPVLRQTVLAAGDALGIRMQEGVYIQVSGPNFETPAEIRAYGTLGADIVGMSTAVEAVAARHMGIRVCGISCVANMASGLSKTPLTHEEVQETANRVAPDFKRLLTAAIKRAGK
ncbi:purine-nucleoside phosphorylase [Oscillospiraceae bacterium CM]|nr:purine-nucleoside phosphorylase [Oscillospiraceae bacterium CM]